MLAEEPAGTPQVRAVRPDNRTEPGAREGSRLSPILAPARATHAGPARRAHAPGAQGVSKAKRQIPLPASSEGLCVPVVVPPNVFALHGRGFFSQLTPGTRKG